MQRNKERQLDQSQADHIPVLDAHTAELAVHLATIAHLEKQHAEELKARDARIADLERELFLTTASAVDESMIISMGSDTSFIQPSKYILPPSVYTRAALKESFRHSKKVIEKLLRVYSGKTEVDRITLDAFRSGNRMRDLYDELMHHAGSSRDVLWGYSVAEEVRPVITPQYEDDTGRVLLPEHSADMLNTWRDAIARGKKYVDVTGLSAPDEGAFTKALREGVRRLAIESITGNEINIRILFSNIHVGYVQVTNTLEVLRGLIGVLPKRSKLNISVGTLNATSGLNASWNHSKIVAADDDVLFTGGHNLCNNYLLDPARPLVLPNALPLPVPAHDVSVILNGPGTAVIAHHFANVLWAYVERFSGTYTGAWASTPDRLKSAYSHTYRYLDQSIREDVLSPYTSQAVQVAEAASTPIATPVSRQDFISVGRLGTGHLATRFPDANAASDVAMVALIIKAKNAVFLSQQRLFPLVIAGYQIGHSFNNSIIEALVSAIQRGCHVYILTSSDTVRASGVGILGYRSGFPDQEVIKIFHQKLLAKQVYPATAGHAVTAKITRHLHVLPTANGVDEVANHSKVVISDANYAYIGSSNVYDNSHAEFGVILGSPFALQLLQGYFKPLWMRSVAQWERSVDTSDFQVQGAEAPSALETVVSAADGSTAGAP